MKKILVGLIIFVVIWFAILIQINLFNVITLAGTASNLGVVLVVSLGLMCGHTVGGIIGFTYGLLVDILYGKTIGLYVLSYLLLGYFCGKIGRDFSKENKTTIVAITGIGTILFEIFYCALGIFICDYDFSLFNFIITVLKEAIYNMIIAIILFQPTSFLAEIINKSKNSYYLL